MSIVPCLLPKGIASAITTLSDRGAKFKILLLNNSNDRETTGFESATDYVKAIVDACHSSLQAEGKSISSESSWSDYVTHLIYLRDCPIPIDAIQLKERGVECVGVLPVGKKMVFEPRSLERVLSGVCSGRGSGLQRRATIQNR